jgi:hypothetical protein
MKTVVELVLVVLWSVLTIIRVIAFALSVPFQIAEWLFVRFDGLVLSIVDKTSQWFDKKYGRS